MAEFEGQRRQMQCPGCAGKIIMVDIVDHFSAILEPPTEVKLQVQLGHPSIKTDECKRWLDLITHEIQSDLKMRLRHIQENMDWLAIHAGN